MRSAPRFTLGLQRRLMLYAATGLAVVFVAWGVVSVRGVDRIAALFLRERLTAAESVAAWVSSDLTHVARDLHEDLSGVDVDNLDALRRGASSAFGHLGVVDADVFRFFEPTDVLVVRPGGDMVRVGRADSPLTEVEAVSLVASIGRRPTSVAVSTIDASLGKTAFAVVSVPLTGDDALEPATAHVLLRPLNSTNPLLGLVPVGPKTTGARDQGKYHLEIVDARGIVRLGIGPDHGLGVGSLSKHWPVFERTVTEGRREALLHRVQSGDTEGDHAVAAVPIPLSDMYVLLEKDPDAAMILPGQLQGQFVVIGVVGFVVAIAGAWIIARRVVRPTEQLTAAAKRMASGDLATPIRVEAGDEIARLSQSIEATRVQLASALDEREKANRELESRVQDRTEELREALRHVITAQEEERQRLARDLHDDVGQELIVLARGIDDLRRKDVSSGTDNTEEVERLGNQARDVHHKLRQVSRNLRPSVLDDLGLVPALSWLGSQATSRGRLKVSVVSEDALPRLDPDVELALFRIAQEAIANVERHAGTDAAEIVLARRDGRFTLAVRDQGCGFEVPSLIQSAARLGKFGLIGMTERAALVDGVLDIESEPGQGTVIAVSVPAG